jgi:hypothetical protein
VLEWSWAEGGLLPQEFFAVRAWPAEQAGPGDSVAWVREISYRLDVSGFKRGRYKWNVAVVQATEEKPFWESLSHDSLIREFELMAPEPPENDKTPTPAGGG